MGPTGQEINPQGTIMMNNDNAGVYNLSEIWPGYEMNGLALDHHPMVHTTTNGYDNNHVNVVVPNESDGKRRKEVEKSVSKVERDSGKVTEQSAKPAEQLPKQDFIHVRARRGQATDSHSLAERARREKISERMKILQDLVPGCNKVIGKALVLDEIINYIQSLQRQVEFLSLKLETVNARGIDPSKDFAQQPFEAPGMQFGSQSSREYPRGSSPEWLHMQLGGGFARSS